MTSLQILGSAGNIAFAWACVPTAWRTLRAGKSIGTPIGLAWNIWIACALFYAYTFLSYRGDILVWIGGAVEITAHSLVIWLHYFPRNRRT
jgi:hypothetical protein